jgi:hypothetical protein
MTETLISFNTVKLAKDKGFDTDAYIKIGELNQPHNWHKEQFSKDYWYFNITQSLLQKWLREKYDIEVFIKSEYKNGKKIGFYYGGDLEYSRPIFKTYEEALEKGLQEALKLIKK